MLRCALFTVLLSNLSIFITDVGRVRHVFCAVTRRMRHRVMRQETYGLLRNGWRVTQNTLTRPHLGLSKHHSTLTP